MIEEIIFSEYRNRVQQRCIRSEIIAADAPYVFVERDGMGISVSVHTVDEKEEYEIEFVREGVTMTPEGALAEARKAAVAREIELIVVNGV